MIRDGETTDNITSLSEVRHSPLPLPVPVSGGLRTLGTSDLSGLRIDSVRELGQRVLLLGGVDVGLLLQLA